MMLHKKLKGSNNWIEVKQSIEEVVAYLHKNTFIEKHTIIEALKNESVMITPSVSYRFIGSGHIMPKPRWLFVKDETIKCPKCKKQYPLDNEWGPCPNCKIKLEHLPRDSFDHWWLGG